MRSYSAEAFEILLFFPLKKNLEISSYPSLSFPQYLFTLLSVGYLEAEAVEEERGGAAKHAMCLVLLMYAFLKRRLSFILQNQNE